MTKTARCASSVYKEIENEDIARIKGWINAVLGNNYQIGFRRRSNFRKFLNPVEQYLEVEWQWIDNSPPAPSSAPANYGLRNRTPEEQESFIKECQLWEDQEIIVPVEKGLMKNTIPLMCVEQAHKISTSIRPVGDYKRKLNKHLVSTPNEDHDHPLSANLMIIRCRSLPIELKDAFLVDVSKAYMRIRVNPKQTYYLCFILPW